VYVVQLNVKLDASGANLTFVYWFTFFFISVYL
jgi:hypothetical protein